jgi:hypothetical protein
MKFKNPFATPKRKFCQLCGEELVVWYKTGGNGWDHEIWTMLSCPTLENSNTTFAWKYNQHYSTILGYNPKQPKYDIYTGKKLEDDGNPYSVRREK